MRTQWGEGLEVPAWALRCSTFASGFCSPSTHPFDSLLGRYTCLVNIEFKVRAYHLLVVALLSRRSGGNLKRSLRGSATADLAHGEASHGPAHTA